MILIYMQTINTVLIQDYRLTLILAHIQMVIMVL